MSRHTIKARTILGVAFTLLAGAGVAFAFGQEDVPPVIRRMFGASFNASSPATGQSLIYDGTNITWGVPGAGSFPLLAPNGTAAAPSYTFSAETTLGVFRSAAGVLGLGSTLTRFALGDGTAAFPALTRNGASINCTLGDGSAQTSLSASSLSAAAGGVFNFASRTAIQSTADGNLSLSNNAGTTFGLFQLGGISASFPAIKRNAAALNFRLADDSADCAITAAGITASGQVLSASGTNALPGHAFSSGTSSGLFFDSGNSATVLSSFTVKVLAADSGGTNNQINVFNNPISGGTISTFGNSSDAWLYRNAAGNWAVSSAATLNKVALLGSNGFRTVSGGALGFSSSATDASTSDCFLSRRGAASSIGLSNATNPTIFRSYGTSDSDSGAPTNWEAFEIITAAGNHTIGTNKGGTGVARGLVIQTGGTAALTFDTAQAATLAKKIASYNGVTTVGFGVPAIVAGGRFTGQTAAKQAAAFTPAADGSFEISACMFITTSTSYSITLNVTYTDPETSAVNVVPLTWINPTTGALSQAAITQANAGVIPISFLKFRVRAKNGTVVSINSAGTFTTVTYNIEADLKQVS